MFGEDVTFVDLGLVRPKGNILQITSKSFSRFTINENKNELIRLADNLMNQYNPWIYVNILDTNKLSF